MQRKLIYLGTIAVLALTAQVALAASYQIRPDFPVSTQNGVGQQQAFYSFSGKYFNGHAESYTVVKSNGNYGNAIGYAGWNSWRAGTYCQGVAREFHSYGGNGGSNTNRFWDTTAGMSKPSCSITPEGWSFGVHVLKHVGWSDWTSADLSAGTPMP